MMKKILIVLAVLVGLISLSFAFGLVDILYTKTIGAGKEDARREVYENTQSYVEGIRQESIKYRLEYIREKDPIAKAALKSMMAHKFANFDEEKQYKNGKISAEIRDFIHDMKYNP